MFWIVCSESTFLFDNKESILVDLSYLENLKIDYNDT